MYVQIFLAVPVITIIYNQSLVLVLMEYVMLWMYVQVFLAALVIIIIYDQCLVPVLKEDIYILTEIMSQSQSKILAFVNF